MAKAKQVKIKAHKGPELTASFREMTEGLSVAPDGMKSDGDGKDKNLKRDLEMRVNLNGSHGLCVRCTDEIGPIGYISDNGMVCPMCAQDIKRGKDTRQEWWRNDTIKQMAQT